MERQCNTHSTSVASKTRCRAFRSCCQRSSRLPDSSTSPRSRHVELRCSPTLLTFISAFPSFPSLSTAPSVLRFLLIHPPEMFARCTQCESLSSTLSQLKFGRCPTYRYLCAWLSPPPPTLPPPLSLPFIRLWLQLEHGAVYAGVAGVLIGDPCVVLSSITSLVGCEYGQ